MAYIIYFTNKDNLYLEVGFDTRKVAKKKLEEIANCFPNDKAAGEVWFRNGYVDKTAYYDITYKDKKAVLSYTRSKKFFKNSR